jgi:sigma-54 specific flagellar transcriptional regulator A
LESLIIGESAAIRELRGLIGRVARSDASVLVTGPSGSGKELVAQAIHRASGRAGQAFVALNCGAIPAELMESELFGHERGAFTGASARRIGRFEEAHRGTLFLDEIGDMRFDMQVKLLRVLEDGLVQRVGGGAPFVSDVRIVSATHQDIDGAIAANRFREDLYFRLGVVPIRVPSLAERVEVRRLLAWFDEKFDAEVTRNLLHERQLKHARPPPPPPDSLGFLGSSHSLDICPGLPQLKQSLPPPPPPPFFGSVHSLDM